MADQDRIPGMSFSQAELDAAIANAREEDETRSVEGAVAALTPCARHCAGREGLDHHWMPDFDDTGEPLMVCKHCQAWREMMDADLDDDAGDEP